MKDSELEAAHFRKWEVGVLGEPSLGLKWRLRRAGEEKVRILERSKIHNDLQRCEKKRVKFTVCILINKNIERQK